MILEVISDKGEIMSRVSNLIELFEIISITDMYCEKEDIVKITEILADYQDKEDYSVVLFVPSLKGKPQKLKTPLYKLSLYNRQILKDVKIRKSLKSICTQTPPPTKYER